MDEIEDASVNFLEQFNDIKFLWEEELEESFEKFLATGVDPRDEFIAGLKKQAEAEGLGDATECDCLWHCCLRLSVVGCVRV